MNHISSSSQLTIETDPLLSKEISEPQDTVTDERKLPELQDKFEEIILEAVQGNLYDLSYTCLLLPRSDSDFLLGEVVVDLQSWMEQICISFGWHLGFLSVKVDYLHWTIREIGRAHV